MPNSVRTRPVLALLAFHLAACSGPTRDRDAVDAGAGDAANGAPEAFRAAAAPKPPDASTSVRYSPLGLAANPTCIVDTALADFQAGLTSNCDVATSPGNVTLLVTPQLDQQNTTVTTNGFGFTATSWAGQSFIPSVSGPLNRIDLDLFCSGCSGTTPDLAVSIRATTGTPAVPTGADLATATITGFTNSTGTYFTASFASPLTVTSGTAYAVVMHPVANPSSGVYAYVCSCTTSTNPYTRGQRVTSSNSGASWTADTTAGGRDLGFSVYIGSGFAASGTFTSSTKDANPNPGDTVHWSSLAWSDTTPVSTTLQFQVAASNLAAGPFSFVGPDGTAATFFATGDSLAQFDGNRYLEYKALLGTSDTTQTSTIQDVTTCFSNGAPTVPTALAVDPASAAFGATASLSATLTASATGLSGRTVSFALNSTPVGTATTDAQGIATITGVSITGIEPGVYTSAIAATYDGETGFAASAGSSDLTVTLAPQTIVFAALANKLMTDPAFAVSATGGASGSPVTFSTTSPACSVTGTTVTLVATGTCDVQADQAGTPEYTAAAPVTQSFTISRATQTITFPVITAFSWSGGSATLAATASSSLAVAYSVVSGPCSVAGATLTATAAGSCVVAADQAGNTSYGPATRVTQTASVTQAGQTISFAPLADKRMTDGAFTVAATGGASGNPVTFSTSSPACSVAGTTVTLVAAGTCALQADQAGNANYTAAAPVTQSFTISRTTQTITFPAILAFSWSGGSATLAATASSSLAVAYSVVSGPCSVLGVTLTATAAGSCVVAADQAGDASYSAAPQVTQAASVTQAVQTISFAPLADKRMTDPAFAVTATGGASGNPVTLSTTSPACSVTGTTVTLVAAGTCALQADQAGNANFLAAAPVTQSFAISLATQAITFPAIADFSWNGGSATLTATASSQLAVSYTVQSGPCSVDGATLTATAPGTCQVAAHQAGNTIYSAASDALAAANVTRSLQSIAFPAVASFSWNGGSATLSATASSALAVSYSVQSGPCSVTGAVLTATAGGTCVVIADQGGNVSYSAAPPVAITVTVANTDQTIAFPDIVSFPWSGGSAELAATASSNLTVVYSVVSGPCGVSGALLTAASAGTCVVAADQPGDTNYAAAARVTASVTVTRAEQIIVFDAIPDHLATDPAFAITATGSDSSSPVTFSTRSASCSVSGTTVTLLAAGTCELQADQAADANFNAAPPAIRSFTVELAAQTIQLAGIPGFAWKDGSANLAATASSGLPVTLHVTSGPCHLEGTTLTATTGGSCTVAADQAGSERYGAAAQVTQTVAVAKINQAIAFGVIAEFAVTDTATLAAVASSGLPVSYRITSGPCTVTENVVRADAPGTCVIAADQGGDDGYNPAPEVTASATVTADPGAGCSCSSTNHSAASSLWIALVALVVRRRRRSPRSR